MTDRELLELAAKAAGNGAKWLPEYDGDDAACGGCFSVGGIEWNPLTDDGDALRLAVNLKITPEQHIAHPYVKAFAKDIMGCEEEYENDPYAATRRAIVRAAAEIGRGLSQSIKNDVPEDNYDKDQAEAYVKVWRKIGRAMS